MLRQNLHGAADQQVGAQGDRVALAWADEHVIDLDRAHRTRDRHHQEENHENSTHPRRDGRAGLALAAAWPLRHRRPAATAAATAATAPPSEQGGFTPPDVPMATSSATNEGQLSILAWPGYAEDGSTDKTVDWVTPFEEETGCQVTVKYFGTSDEAVSLMKTGEYDVVVGLRRRDAAADRRRRRRAGQHRPDPELRGRSTTSSRTSRGTPSTARCTASRTAAAPTC